MPELTALVFAGLLHVFQYVLMAAQANRELGPSRTLSPRDGMNLEAELSPVGARLVRALRNHFEALILFTVAVVAVAFTDNSSVLTTACAWTYLAARMLYVPAYAFGWLPWRSVIWSVGFLATTLMLLAALL